MHNSFTRHNAKQNFSSQNVFEYLQKENNKIKELNEKELANNGFKLFREENFFTHDVFAQVSKEDAIKQIDENLGCKSKNVANFYMLNIAPSHNELLHMHKIAKEELERRGVFEKDFQSSEETKFYYKQNVNELVKMQIKMYVHDVMDAYARNFDREVFIDQDNLPTDKQRSEYASIILERYNQFLIDKGFERDKENYIEISKYNIDAEFETGKIFSFYNEELEKDIKLFVPNNSFKIENKLENGKLLIQEKYFIDKFDEIKFIENNQNKFVEIKSERNEIDKKDFIDFEKTLKYSITHRYEEFNEDLDIYFNENEIVRNAGAIQVNKYLLSQKIYRSKLNFLSKKFEKEKEEFFNDELLKNGFDLTKVENEKGEEVYKYPAKVPTEKQLDEVRINAGIEFNKFLVDKKYIEEQERASITNWQSKTTIQAEVLAVGEKAVLMRISDKRFEKPFDAWIPNFTLGIKNDEAQGKETELKATKQFEILNDFYDFKINQELKKHTKETKQFDKYKTLTNEQSQEVKEQESVKFVFKVKGLKKELVFNVKKDELELNKDNVYMMKNASFKHKFEKHLIEHCKNTQYKEEYERIKQEVIKEGVKVSKFAQDKYIDQKFKEFLQDKKLIEKEKNDRFKVEAEVLEKKENSSFIAIKNQKGEKIELWVNNSLISSSKKGLIYFKDQYKAEKLINKAIERYQERTKLVPIELDLERFEVKNLTNEKGEKEPVKFYEVIQEHKVLGTLKFNVSEKDLTINDDKPFIQNGKLKYKIEKAEEREIEKQYGAIKEQIKLEVWKEKGHNVEKRKLEGRDLLYFAKIEEERVWKGDDKKVQYNRKLLNKIEELKKDVFPERKLIKRLENSLLRDEHTNEIIKEGLKKGGLNHHCHVTVSKHEKHSKNPKDKVGLSPDVNQKDSTLNGHKVGFDRMEFAYEMERIFDEKFGYDRPEEETLKYRLENWKHQKEEKKERNLEKSNKIGKFVDAKLKGEVKGIVGKGIGLDEIRDNTMIGINIPNRLNNPKDLLKVVDVQSIKNQIIPTYIPTAIPKNGLDAINQILKSAKSILMGQDKGIGY